MLVFLVLAAANSAHLVPLPVTDAASTLSRALLVAAVAAVGMKTALARMAQVGAAAIAMLLVQTAALATLIAVPLMLGLV